MNRRHFLPAALLGFSGGVLSACLWDRDTLADEASLNANTLDIILGQFPHHGSAYYRLRIKRLTKKGDLSVEELNDLAVAHTRLRDYQSAKFTLQKALQKEPDRYETLSNMGVLAKKRGDFENGVKFIELALSIKPEGHMGLGDWYLKALRWRLEHENCNQENPPPLNFIGQRYEDTFSEKHYGLVHTTRGKLSI